MSSNQLNSLNTSISYLKGVGPKRAELLQNELGIFTFYDLIQHLPFRYEDRSQFHKISDISVDTYALQLKGKIVSKKIVGVGRNARLVVLFDDGESKIELVWFKGGKWIMSQLPVDITVVVYGRPQNYKGKWNIPHPEVERADQYDKRGGGGLHPVYSSTEKLTSRGLHSSGLGRLIRVAWAEVRCEVDETLGDDMLAMLQIPGRAEAFEKVHAPKTPQEADRALKRLRFEELLYLQLVLLKQKQEVTVDLKGVRFESVGEKFNYFYKENLPFALTGAQKRVMKEIRADLNTGSHMNRLLQGDVGSGKTIIALMTSLLAIDNNYQACIMAPTEILAQQHFNGITELLGEMDVRVELLTGSVTKSARRPILQGLENGVVDIIIGTHALIEPAVKFQNLGLAVIDEQHKFGVAQRSKLWAKASTAPHVLVMTATPIPRTLAMTSYGDLDCSVLDEMPPGRKEIKTVHRTDANRLAVHNFIEKQILEGRQVYVVYPLIEESATLDHKDLMDGYESLTRRFPLPKFKLSVVHGRMKPNDKEMEMHRFAEGRTQILVATTVIEVGVNVPNATLMVIESAERFGLSQLHQLRGRVGRGGEQSYCILMTKDEFSSEARRRLETMCRTNDGFEIAEVDMEIRGPGDVMGTQQSGVPDLQMADLMRDRDLMVTARYMASQILDDDPKLEKSKNQILKINLDRILEDRPNWSRIS
ncbi:MAG: ATP-dependent DNA helicase RecG [Crocinitomicaceae bacterium]|nr:ATP-dependent DNA helicase RecG [Crocinitomicaceae bacterium]|tara:strand:- start:10703 stop:12817 length:2115 start_codon:yes stop_codon:yes gene_type:complete